MFALNRKNYCRIISLSFYIMVILICAAPCLGNKVESSAINFYVAVNGKDHWSGKQPDPKGSDGPFATLGCARDAIRSLKTQNKGKLFGPVTVFVRDGEYFLEETLILNNEDSGTHDFRITYTAYPGEKPILNGGIKLGNWRPYLGKIMQSSLPGTKEETGQCDQLFYGGKRQACARYPNIDISKPMYSGWLHVEGTAEPGSYRAFKYKLEGTKKQWRKPQQGRVFMMSAWGYSVLAAIEQVDDASHAITMKTPVKSFDRTPWFFKSNFDFQMPYRFYVENLLEELDTSGEWCYDSEDNKIYFWPPDGKLKDTSVAASKLDGLISLSHAKWITISGFTLTGTRNAGTNMHRKGYEGYGAMFPMDEYEYCGEAVHLKHAEFCVIENNHFDSVGGNAIYLEGYNLKNIIRRNEISYAGHIGIGMAGNRDYQNVPQHPLANKITDNHIHHCGIFDKIAPGVFCALSDGNIIGNNLIEHTPTHAVNLGDTGYGRNIVEYNRIRHTCQEAHDNAAVMSWMEDPKGRVERGPERSGHIFQYNYISETRGCEPDFSPGHLTFDIYLDSHSSNCIVFGNILVRGENNSPAIRVNGGKNNTIENNIIYDVKADAIIYDNPAAWKFLEWSQMKGSMTGNQFLRNIVVRIAPNDSPIQIVRDHSEDIPRVIIRSDYNLYFNSGSSNITMSAFPHPTSIARVSENAPPAYKDPLTFAEWQNLGYDENSLIANPMFKDAINHDFGLKAGSPAIKLGFKPINMDNIGIRPPK